MYVTRSLSEYRNSAYEPLRLEPDRGPNTGVLVIDDDGSRSRSGCGFFNKMKSVKVLPFPQNKILKLMHFSDEGEDNLDYLHVLIIPVLNQPFSANEYYIIKSRGKTKGLACTSSNEDDPSGCCCFNINHTTRTQLFNPRNAHQQFQIYDYTNCMGPNGFKSKSMAPNGIPPYFLRHKGWKAYSKTLKNFTPTQALGLDTALRARLPALDSEPVVVGRWYCPFIFVRDGKVDAQVKNSPYYEMTLQQNWEEIFGCYKSGGNNGVAVNVCVTREVVLVGGLSMAERAVVCDGVMWFGSSEVGLSMAIVERVKWEQERGGFIWRTNEDQNERVEIREEFKGMGVWKRCRCYVLLEKFVLKRMDGSLVLTWEFRHIHQIRTKWE